MSNNFQLLHKQDDAHDDAIWCVTWCTTSEDGADYILTGGADGFVKVEDFKFLNANVFPWTAKCLFEKKVK